MLPEGEYSVSVDNFSTWLETEIAARNWRPADLARIAKVPQATIGNILNGNREVGVKVALAIADALDLPPDLVFRQAGLLPPQSGPERDPTFQELLEVMRNLSPEDRRDVTDYALFRFRRSISGGK